MSTHAVRALAVIALMLLVVQRCGGLGVSVSSEALKDWWVPGEQKLKVCLTDLAPMGMCGDYDDPEQYTGFHVKLFKQVADHLGFSEDDYEFECWDWTPLIEELSNPNGSCMVAPTGIDVNEQYLEQGIQFSFPSYKSGFKVLVSGKPSSFDMWHIFSAFHWTVWLAMGLTGPVTGLVVWVVEHLLARPAHEQDQGYIDEVSSLRDTSWKVISKMVDIGEPDANSWPARVVMLAYGFLCIMMMNLFTANTAALVTETRLTSAVRGKQDLVGKAVGCWENDVPNVAKYGIRAVGFPWENNDDLRHMVDLLLRGKVKALILDTPVVDWLAHNYTCTKLQPVGENFDTFQLAFAFRKGTPSDVLDQFSVAMVQLQQQYSLLDKIEKEIISHEECLAQQPQSTSNQISFLQVASLWIILGCAMALCIIIMQLQRNRRYRRFQLQLLLQTQQSMQSAANLVMLWIQGKPRHSTGTGGSKSADSSVESSARVTGEPHRGAAPQRAVTKDDMEWALKFVRSLKTGAARPHTGHLEGISGDSLSGGVHSLHEGADEGAAGMIGGQHKHSELSGPLGSGSEGGRSTYEMRSSNEIRSSYDIRYSNEVQAISLVPTDFAISAGRMDDAAKDAEEPHQ